MAEWDSDADDRLGVVTVHDLDDGITLIGAQSCSVLAGGRWLWSETGGRARRTASIAPRMRRSPSERTIQPTLRAGRSFSEVSRMSTRSGVKHAALDTFRGYANALRDDLGDAITVLDAFHVVKLGTQVTDEVRRRVQQDTLHRRGHRGDPCTRSGASSGTAPRASPRGRSPACTRPWPRATRTTR
jgi:hypothetical protein